MSNRTRSLASVALLALVAAGPLAAQDRTPARTGSAATTEGMPDGWMMRLDRPAAGTEAVDFRVMEPGWHVTTDRAGSGVFWQPEMHASGTFDATARMHLMQPAAHPEAFGIFLGGTELEGPDQAYLYFLVRQTGEYLIKRRVGDETETVVDWTRHPAVPVATANGTTDYGSTAYDLGVHVGDTEVRFTVDGQTVEALPAAELETDGMIGLRVNHRLDVHVEELGVEDT